MAVRRFFWFPGSPSAPGLGGPVAHDVLEFQGQAAETAWYNLLAKIGLYGERIAGCDVQEIGVSRSGMAFPT